VEHSTIFSYATCVAEGYMRWGWFMQWNSRHNVKLHGNQTFQSSWEVFKATYED